MSEAHKYKYLDPAALAKMGRLNIVAKGVVEGFITGLHRSPYHGFSVEFAEHRAYVPGDNPKDVDWQAYARSDRYMVKQYQEETNLRAHIVLDVSASMGYRSQPDSLSKLEYASFLAACFAYLLARQQDPIGLITFDDDVRSFIPPRSTMPHLNLLLRALEQLEPSRKTNVAGAFHRVAEHLKKRGLIIIISDLYDEPREVIKALHHFRHKKHEVMLFHIFDQAEVEFPFGKLTEFVDMETNEQIQVDPNYVRDEYIALVKDFIETYRKDCLSSQIEYAHTHTGVPYDKMLWKFLANRKNAL